MVNFSWRKLLALIDPHLCAVKKSKHRIDHIFDGVESICWDLFFVCWLTHMWQANSNTSGKLDHQEQTWSVFIKRLLHTLPSLALADVKILHWRCHNVQMRSKSFNNGGCTHLGRRCWQNASPNLLGFCDHLDPIYWVFVGTLKWRFAPRCVWTHQRQTRSVPLDWVFVVPPGALVAVRALQMKYHHSQDTLLLNLEVSVTSGFSKEFPCFEISRMSKFYWAISVHKKVTRLQNLFSIIKQFFELYDFLGVVWFLGVFYFWESLVIFARSRMILWVFGSHVTF